MTLQTVLRIFSRNSDDLICEVVGQDIAPDQFRAFLDRPNEDDPELIAASYPVNDDDRAAVSRLFGILLVDGEYFIDRETV